MSGYFPRKDISTEQRRRMSAIAGRYATKAAKIRTLHAAGFDRATIASFLEIRYQHVRNALVSRPTQEPAPVALAPSGEAEADAAYGRCKVDEAGRVALPPALLGLLDARPGDDIPWRFEDGELRLMGRAAGLRFAQSLVADLAKRHPGDWSSALLAERRAEAAGDGRGKDHG